VSEVLANLTAIVTGASSGIGRAIALALAAEGMGLRLIGRDPARLEDTARAAKQRCRNVGWSAVDLIRLAEIDGYVRQVTTETIDVLIHSAGLYARGPHDSRSPAEYGMLFAANVTGPMYLTQRLLPALREARGQVVFINSTQGLAGSANVGIFAATQHALRAMADTLRDEVNEDGIRVLTVYAGRTATPRQQRIFELEGRPYAPEKLLQPEDIAAMICAALKLPRTAEVTNMTIRPMRKS
jgi:NADP-dependent 3-hydroxy acid dehydrogenase YdfG